MGRTLRIPLRAPAAALAVLLSLICAGCQSMPRKYPSVVPDSADGSWPLRFSEHNFGARCFDTYGCKVFYGAFQQVDDDAAVLRPSSASHGPDYRKNWTGSHGGLRNFPEPAHVTWRSKDGAQHEARIDMAAIFADQKVVHHVPREDIPPGATIGPPDILLEVNDRTINVYMRADIPTEHEQIPGNRYSRFIGEAILVKSYHY